MDIQSKVTKDSFQFPIIFYIHTVYRDFCNLLYVLFLFKFLVWSYPNQDITITSLSNLTTKERINNELIQSCIIKPQTSNLRPTSIDPRISRTSSSPKGPPNAWRTPYRSLRSVTLPCASITEKRPRFLPVPSTRHGVAVEIPKTSSAFHCFDAAAYQRYVTRAPRAHKYSSSTESTSG